MAAVCAPRGHKPGGPRGAKVVRAGSHGWVLQQSTKVAREVRRGRPWRARKGHTEAKHRGQTQRPNTEAAHKDHAGAAPSAATHTKRLESRGGPWLLLEGRAQPNFEPSGT